MTSLTIREQIESLEEQIDDSRNLLQLHDMELQGVYGYPRQTLEADQQRAICRLESLRSKLSK